jgi:hypothetical protein
MAVSWDYSTRTRSATVRQMRRRDSARGGLWAFVYVALRDVLGLVVLLGRSDAAKEIELLGLRHEVGVLRRHIGRTRYEPADRALLAALSRLFPRSSWHRFRVRPQTPGTAGWWHGAGPIRIAGPVARRSTVDEETTALVLRLATENPR